ncbi:MAG: universal stress protein [Bacteroidales bacterium]
MENENKKIILVAYDFTKVGDIAIENATQMAKVLKFDLCLLHVINKNTRSKLKKNKETPEVLNKRLSAIAEKVKQKDQVTTEFMTCEGGLFSSVAKVAREINAKFLVFGTHGKKGIQFLLGSYALKLIKSCPVPVLVVQKPVGETQFKDIVFPLGIEPGSKQKVKWAISFFKLFKCKFHIFIDAYKDEYVQKKVRADHNQIKKIMDKHQIPYSSNFSPPDYSFSTNCIKFADSINADMIMFSTDPDKITWNLFGSQDERIIYNSKKIPVMCINAQDLHVIIGGM